MNSMFRDVDNLIDVFILCRLCFFLKYINVNIDRKYIGYIFKCRVIFSVKYIYKIN